MTTPNSNVSPHPLPSPQRGEGRVRGFTLVEVIVSMVIVAITAAGIFASFIAAQNYVQRSRGKIMAINAERAELERLRAAVREDGWGSIPPNTATCNPDTHGLMLTATCTDGWTAWGDFAGTFGGPPWNGRRRYNVTAVLPGGPRQIRVDVRWTEPGG